VSISSSGKILEFQFGFYLEAISINQIKLNFEISNPAIETELNQSVEYCLN
jgi:hypothetical protein